MPSNTEKDIQNAITTYTRSEYKSVSRTAAIFNIPRTTLLFRLQNNKSRKQGHEKQQLLSTIEEEELIAWSTNASQLGVPTPLSLVKNLAKEIRTNRFATRSDSLDSPISTR